MLGRELKKLRDRSGVSAAAAARAIEVSPQTLWRMESGQEGPKLKELYVNVLCDLYGVSDSYTEVLVGLVGETKKPGWWYGFVDSVPTEFDLFMGLEETTRRLTSFQQTLVPGLLQIPEYRRALAWTQFPTRSSEALEPWIEILVRRQQRLRDGDPDFEFRALVCESALRNQVGSRGVMEEQLVHMATVGSLPNVSIRIVPQQAGNHLGLIAGSFVLMEFPVHRIEHLTEPPVIYVQGYTGALYLDQDSEIRQYRAAVAEIQRMALDEPASRQLLLETSKEYRA
jgi:transcriptional regulator with XRE-family HTH domain